MDVCSLSELVTSVTSEHAHTHIPTCARHLHKPSLGVKHSDKKNPRMKQNCNAAKCVH